MTDELCVVCFKDGSNLLSFVSISSMVNELFPANCYRKQFHFVVGLGYFTEITEVTIFAIIILVIRMNDPRVQLHLGTHSLNIS